MSPGAPWERELLRELAPLIPFPEGVAVHLAFMRDPWMSRFEAGTKTIESRWSMNRCAPWRAVDTNDVIVFKRAAGPLAGWARVDSASFHRLTPDRARQIVENRREPLGVDAGFEDLVASKNYATLIGLDTFHALAPSAVSAITLGKTDRRGWVIIRARAAAFRADASHADLADLFGWDKS